MRYLKSIINFILYPFGYLFTAFTIMSGRRASEKKRKIAFGKFLEEHKDAIHGWYKLNGLEKKPPIIYDSQQDRYRWVHREARRKIMRQLRRRNSSQ